MKTKITKMLTLLVALSIMLLVGCSGGGENSTPPTEPTTKDDSIQLTLDNYSDYLNVKISDIKSDYYIYYDYVGKIEGVSTKYDYNDVKIKIAIHSVGSKSWNDDKTCTMVFDVSTDISGSKEFSGTGTFYYDSDNKEAEDVSTYSGNLSYEVTEVSGYLTK